VRVTRPVSPAGALVGRDGEMALLTGLVKEVAQGRGRSVLVEGEPGIGKSALVRAAVAEAPTAGSIEVIERRAAVFSGDCEPVWEGSGSQSPRLNALRAASAALGHIGLDREREVHGFTRRGAIEAPLG
jgi:predicted ATPase